LVSDRAGSGWVRNRFGRNRSASNKPVIAAAASHKPEEDLRGCIAIAAA
jgi:hypothetical protein